MWSIQSLKDSSCSYNFLVGTEYVVGRKSAAVLLTDDLSISRRHAVLTVVHPIENLTDPTKTSELQVKDAASKYGTFKNNFRLEKEQLVQLQSGDTVKFGQFESAFKVCYTPLVITTSCIIPSLKNELKQIVHKLGGHLISEWRTCCTHLVMSGVKVTVKALCCLMSLKQIISPSFLIDLSKSFLEKTSPPEASNYLPPINEPMVDKEKAMFTMVEKRKTLFQNKRFIFLEDKQMRKLYLALTMGGANATLIDENSTPDVDLITDRHSCVVQPMGERMNDQKFAGFVKKLTSILQRKKKRMIPESDFGLAVAYSSTEKFCNPDFLLGNAFVATPNIPSQTFTQQEVYVPDTDDRERSNKRKLSEFLSSFDDIPSKRTHPAPAQRIVEESQDVCAPKKRPLAIESSPSTSGESSKCNPSTKRIKTEVCEDENQEQFEAQTNSVMVLPVKVETVESVPESSNVDVCESVPLTDFTLRTTDRSLQPLPPGAVAPKMTRSFSNISLRTAASHRRDDIFHGKPNKDEIEPNETDEDLPRNLIKIAFANLVKPREPLTPVSSENCSSGVKNFKKFKKVIHAGAHNLPKIIGGSDLVVHRESSSKAIGQWLQENAVDQASENLEEAGEFDWDFPKRNKVRGR